jgi:hypothetical protein
MPLSSSPIAVSNIQAPKTEVVVGAHSSNQIVKEMRKRGGMKYFAVEFEGQLMRDGIFYAIVLWILLSAFELLTYR